MISAVVLTKDEEKNIKECLKSLSWCDEIIVIDDNSTDKTADIAKQKSARIYIHPLDNDFSQQRNFGLEKAKGDWVLFIDADERVSTSLWYEIMQHINDPLSIDIGYIFKRRDSIWGRELRHGEIGNTMLLRLAKKNVGEWQGKVHEAWKVKGKVCDLQHPIMHFPHKTVTEFLEDLNFYTTIRAKELFEKKVRVHFWTIIFYPTAKFFVNYLIKQGYKDGTAGFIFACFMSFHSFLVRGKLWQLWTRKKS